MRRGLRADFDPSKMLPGEWAVSTDKDTKNQIVWMCFSSGVCKRMGTYEDFQSMINEISGDIINEYQTTFNVILNEVQTLSEEVADNADSVAVMHTELKDTIYPEIEQILADTETTVRGYLEEAKASEESAEASKNAAATSATNASKSASAAKTSETNAKASEDTIKASEQAAKTHADAAKESETNAKSSETAAKTSETNAKNSETAAKTSETNSATSATNAQTSADNAEGFASDAEASANAAKASADAAKASQDNAKSSEDKAKEYLDTMEAISAVEIATVDQAGIVKPDGKTLSIESDGTLSINQGFGYGVCSTAGGTVEKAVVCEGFKLIAGASITIKFSVANTAGNPTLNVNGTGAKSIMYKGSVLNGAYLGANKVYAFVYDGTYWQLVGDLDTDIYDRLRFNGNIKCGTSAITAGNVIVGSNEGYQHLKSGRPFDIKYPIMYAAQAISASGTGNLNYTMLQIAIATTQSMTLTAFKPIYIKGTLNGTTFIPVNTTPLTQSQPTYEDGYDYMYLGMATSTTHLYLVSEHPIYTFKNGLFRIKEDVNVKLSSTLISNWEGSGSGQSDTINGIAYGNGRCVAVTGTGKVLYTDDINVTNWQSVTLGTSYLFQSVCYGNGMFAAAGYYTSNSINFGIIYYSTDGSTWNLGAVLGDGKTHITLREIAYGNDRFVVVGGKGINYYSTDLKNWTAGTVVTNTPDLFNLIYANGVFIAGGTKGIISRSLDGKTWINCSVVNTGYTIYGLSYGNGKFVAVCSGGAFGYSDDGVTWNFISPFGGTIYCNSVAYGNGIFVAVGEYSFSFCTLDGITWIPIGGLGGSGRFVCYADETFVGVGDNGMVRYAKQLSYEGNIESAFNYLADYNEEHFVAKQNGRLHGSVVIQHPSNLYGSNSLRMTTYGTVGNTNCTAFGFSLTAKGNYAFAHGSTGTADGYAAAILAANGANATGMAAVAMQGGTANGENAFAFGRYTKAQADQLVFGTYNVEDTASKYAMIIGNGTSNTARSNAFAVGRDGAVECAQFPGGRFANVKISFPSSTVAPAYGSTTEYPGATRYYDYGITAYYDEFPEFYLIPYQGSGTIPVAPTAAQKAAFDLIVGMSLNTSTMKLRFYFSQAPTEFFSVVVKGVR